MNGLARSQLRLIWIALVLVLSVGGLLAFRSAHQTRALIDQRLLELDAAYRELENAERLSAAVKELDEMTIDERTATRLEILRHLGLEQNNYRVEIASRQAQQVGSNALYLRNLKVTAALPYPAGMGLVDRLHNTRKMVLSSVTLEPDTETPGYVRFIIEGPIYGLEKSPR